MSAIDPFPRSGRDADMAAGLGADPDESAALATELMRRAEVLETRAERRARTRFGALVTSSGGVAFTTALLDRALRPREPRAVAEAVEELVARRPDLRFLSVFERVLLQTFVRTWRLAPHPAVAALLRGLRDQAHAYILDAEPSALVRYLEDRRDEGVDVNVNLVGEAVLGRDEAEARLVRHEEALRSDAIDAVAVKISSICAHVRPLAFERVVPEVSAALRRLYRAAGSKLVTLDMEEYQDLEPTVAAFARVLMEDEFLDRTHGIALQAYLPDTFAALRMLTALGNERVRRGGAPIRIRLVKGANLAMERFVARLSGWTQAPFEAKVDVDANMKLLVSWALRPENAAVAEVGVGSHNVFDIAFAICAARAAGTTDSLCIEMLEGMAEPLRRAVGEIAPRQLLYAPAATDAEFLAAMAYLIRRLDENTSMQNFLRHAFTMRVGDTDWKGQADRFRESCTRIDAIVDTPRRRRLTHSELPRSAGTEFANEPNTDWVQTESRRRAARAIRSTRPASLGAPLTTGDVDGAVAAARADASGWSGLSETRRSDLLRDAAARMRDMRFELIALMAHETHKTAAESDPEVSEAIDLISYYAAWRDFTPIDDAVEVSPRGTVAVFSPWNFPIAIPMGGVAAALAPGNRVLLKPSPYAVRVAEKGCEAFWAAGVPRDALRVLHADVAEAAELAAHPYVDALVFTGSTETASKIVRARPDLRVTAETGGKNTTIVTAHADRDLAIADIVHSAFGHAGQKCSATSIVIAEAEVFDDPSFRRRLEDAMSSLVVGPATDLATDLSHLVTPPNDACREVLSREFGGIPDDRYVVPTLLWDPEWGSTPHMQELFAPLLAVMRADDLADAVRIANSTGYGLTAGLESLRESDWQQWIDSIHAGNLYINRPTTGAVVQRQPFGGWGRSGLGPGAKAGGPNYVAQLAHLEARDPRVALDAAYDVGFAATAHDPQAIPGQANIFRYAPAPNVVIRVEHGDDPHVVQARMRAAGAAGCAVEVSTFSHESAAELASRLGSVTRVVRCGPAADPELLAAAARAWTWVCTDPITGTSLDLLPFLREQAISIDYHRYGWIPPDSDPIEQLDLRNPQPKTM